MDMSPYSSGGGLLCLYEPPLLSRANYDHYHASYCRKQKQCFWPKPHHKIGCKEAQTSWRHDVYEQQNIVFNENKSFISIFEKMQLQYICVFPSLECIVNTPGYLYERLNVFHDIYFQKLRRKISFIGKQHAHKKSDIYQYVSYKKG